ncbi:MFS transporter [Rheinheimera sp.]|uniref:MFS transporter n=1 Tax=Rheinheimera sp. TaxID=1869214 RepID=UPI003D2A269E
MTSVHAKTRTAKPFGRAFYLANGMEIFERLAWYGFFSLSSLYLTSPRSQGGLGFSDQERGFLQGMIPFLLYLLPVLTGALADRYGYRRMFLLSFCLMAPGYFLLGQMHSFWPFFAVFLLVAIGAACFKPVVVGTVGRSSDDSNRGLAFGVFYTMVNIGGFLGPLVAGYLRAISWDLVFLMSSFWILLNFIPALLWYREPQPAGATTADQRSLPQVLLDMQSVLGNGRLALLVLPLLLLLMFSPRLPLSPSLLLAIGLSWLVLNLLWSAWQRFRSASAATAAASDQARPWYRQPIRLGHRPFVVYLLILTGFFTAYMQLFITLPLYLRDYVDTADLVRYLSSVAPGTLEYLAAVNVPQLAIALPAMAQQYLADPAQLPDIARQLAHHKVQLPLADLASGLQQLNQAGSDAMQLAHQWTLAHRQINPEYIVNLGFLSIVLCQIAISQLIQRWPALPVLVGGTVLLSLGLLLCGLSADARITGAALGGGVLAIGGVLLFSLGEMVASPKSQEYVAAIAPARQTAMYMGYYFVAMALGNLFAGLLSGWSYSYFGQTLQQPMLMWGLFALIAGLTATALLCFHYWLRRATSTDPMAQPLSAADGT